MKTGIIIQARLGSTRLPGKVLKPIHDGEGASVIEQIIKRAKNVKNVDIVILATSNKKTDDALVSFLEKNVDVEIFRGSEANVLSRYYDAAVKYDLDQVVRLTGDNPCIDANSITDAIQNHQEKSADYSYTSGLPLGMNVEVVKTSALKVAVEEGVTAPDQEHVTYYVRNHPERFQLNFITIDHPKEFSDLRLTMDTDKDYTTLQIVYDFLYSNNDLFGINEIKNLWKRKPYIFSINSQVVQKNVYKTEKEELIAAIELLEKQDLFLAAKFINKKVASKN